MRPAIGSVWQFEKMTVRVQACSASAVRLERIAGGAPAAISRALDDFFTYYRPVTIAETCPGCGARELHREDRDSTPTSFDPPPPPESYGAWIVCDACGRSFRQAAAVEAQSA